MKNPVRFPALNISAEEYQLILNLRLKKPAKHLPSLPVSLGNRVSDRVAAIVGSWRFILIQSGLLVLWLIANITAYVQHWDPYPFILLNLMLSFQAAYTAPIIMMSQNRQAMIDRQDAQHDYEVNLKAELEIELLHDQLNALRQEELATILQLVRSQQTQLANLTAKLEHR
jgi:uncharacterized membrane protein